MFALFALIAFSLAPASHADDSLTVILDPGHGGEDTGAIRKINGKRIAEKDLTLQIARETAYQLRQKNIKVVLTRTGDKFVDLDTRTELANLAQKKSTRAIFVSIHVNSDADSRSAGIETYVFNAATNEASQRLADLENGKRWSKSHATVDLILADLSSTANYAESAQLACSIQKNTINTAARFGHKTRDRGIRQALFYVLMKTRMPSVLFEPGFISNPQELSRLTSTKYQRLLAHSLAEGIQKWRFEGRGRLLANSTSARATAAMSAVAKPGCNIH